MTNDKQKTIPLQFNECINSQDIQGLATFMTDDHTFIDKANQEIQGKGKAVEAWKGFFALFPDYRNIFERVESRNNLVAIIGHSTCSEKQLDGPALWTAQLRGEKVAEWRVYDDTPENRKRLGLE
jgi:ketosteroid isomerase-like protein